MSKLYQRRWTLSSVKIRESSFHWKISGFSKLKVEDFVEGGGEKCLRRKQLLESPTFSINSRGLKWCLIMFCKKDDNYGPSLYFEFRSKDIRYFKIDASVSLSILSGGDEEKLHKKSYSFYVEHSRKRAYSGFLNNFLPIQDLFDERYGFVKNDELKILCEYRLVPKHKRSKLHENLDLKSRVAILEAFEKQWEQQEDGDLLLAAPSSQVVLAHRFVLKSRCPHFYEALKHDQKENRTGLIKVEELDYQVLVRMLRFMYAGKIRNLDHESLPGLLGAAQKYEIDDLRDHCEEYLLKNLSVGNASRSLELCEEFGLGDIRPHVEAFLKSNSKTVHAKTANTLVELDEERKTRHFF